jgi:hypothetical protein
MNIPGHRHEHELEPQYGLPERLPPGERILWQGSPDAKALALSAFHLRKLLLYFGALLALRGGFVVADGGDLGSALSALLWPALLAGAALAAVVLLAWLTARTTVYTLTDRRVVMRIGIVLTLAFNLPLARIASAGLRTGADGCGDIVLGLAGTDRIAWLQLWPHVRPWRLARPEPMLRALPDATSVAATLSAAWSKATGVELRPAAPARDSGAAPVLRPSPT